MQSPVGGRRLPPSPPPLPHPSCRDEIASCSEKAYARLRVADAQKMMMLDNEAAVRDFAGKVRQEAG